jgi:hypothetical protein
MVKPTETTHGLSETCWGHVLPGTFEWMMDAEVNRDMLKGAMHIA